MLKHVYKYYLNFDTKLKNLMKHGFLFSFFMLIIAAFILFTYRFFYTLPLLYYIGLSLFKVSIIYFVTFLCFGFAFNKILSDIL